MAASRKSEKSNGLPIPVIDLFAGPGGLGEGFSSLPAPDGGWAFRIRLSIEKDPVAHHTLELRAFFRQFPSGKAPLNYYRHIRGEIGRDELFNAYPDQAEAARNEAWQCELGVENAGRVRNRINMALEGADRWILIGGPPCQAYSIAGRSRNAGIKNYDPAQDPRQKLYVEYLQVIADHTPAVFVMENVKGLLSAKVENVRIFEKILADLQSPCEALRTEGRPVPYKNTLHYTLHSLSPHQSRLISQAPSPEDFLIRAEQHGVPQARHRLILVGVRSDLSLTPGSLPIKPEVTMRQATNGLPPLRSGLSKEVDGPAEWLAALRAGPGLWHPNPHGTAALLDNIFIQSLVGAGRQFEAPQFDRGGEFLQCKAHPPNGLDKIHDPRIGGVCNHSTRAHMAADLHRYFFAACFAKAYGRSPTLSDFPKKLLPDHENLQDALNSGHFSDRFRVQLPDRPSTTITSHISKDGHYYIHYDPTQCRSLTVREAARLQTFPDNYFFCGGRTAQYTQVGNAVPPLLAAAIANVLYEMLK